MIDCEAGGPPDLPKPTPMRASACVATLCAMPQKTVIALQNASAIEMMLRRLKRSARRATRGRSARRWRDWFRAKLVANEVSPHDNRESLICLAKAGLAAHDTLVAGAQERNRRLLEQLSKDEFKVLLDQIDRLTDTTFQMLADEKNLG